jgi:adenine-specific DNA-methyltransferase
MRYLGNKSKLVGWIFRHLDRHLQAMGISPRDATFLDGCSGTASVAAHAVVHGFEHVVANDLLPFSTHVARARLCFPSDRTADAVAILRDMNDLPPEEGFFFQNYTAHGDRSYFSEANGRRIDAMRRYVRGIDDAVMQSYLWHCLLEGMSRVANTTGTHGAFLKELSPNALQPLRVNYTSPAQRSGPHHAVYQQDIAKLLKDAAYRERFTETVLYLDPPYNTRQYGSNFHLYSTLTSAVDPVIKGKTGLPENTALSDFCKSDAAEVSRFFGDVFTATRAKIVVVSYSSDSTVSLDSLVRVCAESRPRFTVEVQVREYERFRSSDGEQPVRGDPLYEYLLIATADEPVTMLDLFDNIHEAAVAEKKAKHHSEQSSPTSEETMDVFVHTLDAVDGESLNQGRKFLRLPVVGEYITLDVTGEWYEVKVVVHCPHTPPSTYAAEVYAVRVEHLAALRVWRGRG